MSTETNQRPVNTIAQGLDPEIAEFIARMGQGWSQHPSLADVSFPEQRRIADAVRKPWTEGGPVMGDTRELQVPWEKGEVRIRIYRPAPLDELQPALVYLHGGGWTIFSIDTHDRLMREYAGRAGIAVVGVDYTLSPEVRFPRALEETVAVIRFLRDHGAEYGIDGTRIATGGDSAGANLAISAAIMLRDAGEGDAVAGMLLNYGAFDNDCHNASYRTFGGAGYMLGGTEMEDFWKNYLGEQFAAPGPLAVPLHADLRGLPRAFLVVPDCDVLLDENVLMEEKLRAADVETHAVYYRGASHSFLEAVAISGIAEQAHRDSANWLIETLRV